MQVITFPLSDVPHLQWAKQLQYIGLWILMIAQKSRLLKGFKCIMMADVPFSSARK